MLNKLPKTSTTKIWAGELAQKLEIEIIELSAQHSVATMPVLGNRQPMNLLNGGAHAVMAETLASMSAHEHAKQFGCYAVGMEINATHTRSIDNGIVTAICDAIFLGKTACSHEIIIRDSENNRLSTLRVTNIIRKLPAHG